LLISVPAERKIIVPEIKLSGAADNAHLALVGDWTMQNGRLVERLIEQATEMTAKAMTLDLSKVAAFDTMGALVVSRLCKNKETAGVSVKVSGLSKTQKLLIDEVGTNQTVSVPYRSFTLVDLLEDTGKVMVGIWRDLVDGISFLGAFIAALGRLIINPKKFRWPALVKQIEAFGFRSVPIVALISFLVGGIIAQQSVFQLINFGSAIFVADLLGVLILRELGVLLTSIMIAGRSGSAITAEIGSMKMREEIDALRTMGLDPMEVLIVPRILALILCLPLLTFIASMAGIFGGGLVAWIYGDVSPDVFLSRLQGAVGMNTFMVGMIKAPVMALVIGLIASIEGMAVKGSAESLGRQTTASVVKAIFMVIVVDGLFAMFFASIRY
jgi:phospholipid/cholesterol/gamma-HCH transport system permease protein